MPAQVGHRDSASLRKGLNDRVQAPWRGPTVAVRTEGGFPGAGGAWLVAARAATPHERLRLTWTVDGTVAGKQETITVQAKTPGMLVVRAVVASNLGAAASREWRINVLPPSVPAPAAPTAAPPAEAKPAAPAAAPLASVVPTPPPPDEQGVRSFLDRYAAAWRAHDVDTLRQLGQVTTDEQARTLRDYFAKVGDLEVEIHLIERLPPVFEPLAGNDLEPFEQGLRLLAPVGFDDADDDIVAVALAGAGLLQHFVGLADAGRGTDEDLEPAGSMLFAPRGLEQGLRRRSLVRVAPLIRHRDVSARRCPGRSAAQSGALQTRDRSRL